MHRKRNKTLFVVFSDSFQELTFIRNGLLDDLIKNHKNRCVIIVPTERARVRIRPYFDSSSAEIVVYNNRIENFFERAFKKILHFKFEKYAGPYRKERMKQARVNKKRFRKFKSGIIRIFSQFIPERLVLSIQNNLLSDHFLDSLYWKYRPVLTILSWGGVYDPCPMVIRSARKFNCRTISLDASWDCMDEILVIPKVDKLLVWNEAMKQEALTKHRYDPEHISVIGPMRCDFYRQQKYLASREKFFDKHKLDRARKLITLVINQGDPGIYCQVVNALLEADKKNRFNHPIQVWVRLAPWSDREPYGKLEINPLVKVRSSYSFNSEVLVQENEIKETVNLLRHSDVLISVLSTIILESVYFDIPNISLRFPEFRLLYERDFLDPFFKIGGIQFADDLDMLLDAINLYLINPRQDAEGRNTILDQLCYGGDGLAKKRALAEIAGLVNTGK